MRGLRLIAALLAVVWPGFAPVWAHDRPLTREEVAAFDTAIRVVVAASKAGELEASSLVECDRALAGVATDILDHAEDVESYKALDVASRERVEWLMRSLRYLRGLRTHLKEPVRTSFWLGEGSRVGLSRAMLAICKEPFDEGFHRAVTFLSTDKRPEVRLCSGIAAKFGTLFVGEDKTYVRVAENLLVDEDPRVAAQFGRWHACEFRNVKLIERQIARLKDDRAIPREPLGFMFSGETDISKALMRGVNWYLFVEHGFLHESRKVARENAKNESAEFLAQWWAANSESWFSPGTRNDWVPIFDGVVECEVGKPRLMKWGGRDVELCLKSYIASEGDGEPTVAMEVDFQDSVLKTEAGLDVSCGTTPFSRVASAGNQIFSARVLVAPTQTTSYRLRIWLWFLPNPQSHNFR